MTLYFGNHNINDLSNVYIEHIRFHNSLFNTIKCELYESENDNNISFKLNTGRKAR